MMRWALFTIAVAAFLWMGRNWQRLNGAIPLNVNEDSARRRLAALMPPIDKEQR